MKRGLDFRYASMRMMSPMGGIERNKSDREAFRKSLELEESQAEENKQEAGAVEIETGEEEAENNKSMVMTKAFFLFMIAAGAVQIYVTTELILTGVQANDSSAEAIVAYLVALYLCMSDFTQFEQFLSETYFFTDSSRTKVWNMEGGAGQITASEQGFTYESLTVVLLVELLLLSVQAYLSFGDDVNFILTLVEIGLTLFKILEFVYKRYKMWKKNPSVNVKICGYVIIFFVFVTLLPFVFLVSFLRMFLCRVREYAKAFYLIALYSPWANCDDSTDLVGLADAI